MTKLSPMMQQYMHLKEEHKDTILFFRLGDFYEMFFEDAILASKELELTLTGRVCGLKERAPMCGVPHHAVNTYINRLLDKGYKVAICEQLTEPQKGKTLVERGVVRIVTPGTVIEDALLDEKDNNYLMSLYKEGDGVGLSYADVSTGDFYLCQVTEDEAYTTLLDETTRLDPAEILVNSEMLLWLNQYKTLLKTMGRTPEVCDETYHDYQFAILSLGERFTETAHDLRDRDYQKAVCAAGALFGYLKDTQKNALLHMNKLSFYQPNQYMAIDAFTRKSLEITRTVRTGSKRGTLLWLLDRTVTSMGSRMLRKWLDQPLQDEKRINARLDAVVELKDAMLNRQQLINNLKGVRDIERITTKISYGNLNARDCVALRQSVEVMPQVIEVLEGYDSDLIKALTDGIDPLYDVTNLLLLAVEDNPPIGVKEGGLIKEGYNEDLDRLRDISKNGRQLISNMEQVERDETGIKNLKISYNRVFGYYIEVTKSNLELVPYRYTRKQTLANAERYITEELKELEDEILGAEERSIKLEYDLFTEIREALKDQIERLQLTARAIAQVDALQAFSVVAQDEHYVKPTINTGGRIKIVDGRHPVVEQSLEGRRFVPNHADLDMEKDRFLIITGPNMSGKSTYLRQVAIISLMAHVGCFVPARVADICITDKIFSRVGASDDLFLGQSTFMVEMMELSNIIKNATGKSLIILDEIGRGTSTFDGLSIAWSVVEHICDRKKIGAKTLFATHYHQLSELEGRVAGVKNYCISVREHGDEVIFLRKIVKGGADKSFGIHVAKLAGLPEEVLERAKEILHRLEDADINHAALRSAEEAGETLNQKNDMQRTQLGFEALLPYNDVLEQIKTMDINTTPPLEALYILNKLKDKMS